MRKLTDMRFFQVPEYFSRSEVDLSFLRNAYVEFADFVFCESESSNNLTAFYNQLCYTRIEIQGFKKDKQIKKINNILPIKDYYDKALQLIEAQLKLVELKLIHSYKNQPETDSVYSKSSKIKWTGSNYELVELGYAILATKNINNGDVDIKELINYLCKVFDFDVKNIYHAYTTIRQRTGDRTIYLNKMKEKLMERMEESDNRKRRIG